MENNNLNIKIKQLENISQYKNRILELENEIKLLKSYFLPNGEKLYSIKIISMDQNINLPIIIKNSEYFSEIEKQLYKDYPEYKETKHYFLVNGIIVNRLQTLEQNKIKNNDILTLVRSDI